MEFFCHFGLRAVRSHPHMLSETMKPTDRGDDNDDDEDNDSIGEDC